jgi:hypothetical protein
MRFGTFENVQLDMPISKRAFRTSVPVLDPCTPLSSARCMLSDIKDLRPYQQYGKRSRNSGLDPVS